MKRGKSYEIYPSLLAFVRSLEPYKNIKSIKELSDADIERFSALFWCDRVPISTETMKKDVEDRAKNTELP